MIKLNKFHETAQHDKKQKYRKAYLELIILHIDSCNINNNKIEELEDIKKLYLKKTNNFTDQEKKSLEHTCLTKLFWAYAKESRNFEKAEEYLKHIEQLLKNLKDYHQDDNTDFLSLYPESMEILNSRLLFLKAKEKKFNLNTKEWIETAKEFSNQIDFSKQPNEMLMYMDMRLGQRGEIYLQLGKLLKQTDLVEAKNHFENAKKYLRHSLKISELLKHSHGKAIVYNNLGKTFKELLELQEDNNPTRKLLFEKAKTCFLESYSQDEELSDGKSDKL